MTKAEIIEALEFYANPAIYEPHPHGPAFDRRDLSFKARAALAALQCEPQEPMKDPNCFSACIEDCQYARLMDEVQTARSAGFAEAREMAAQKSTSFLVGNPYKGIPLRSPMPIEIADAIRAMNEPPR